jgi:hypothetical protein
MPEFGRRVLYVTSSVAAVRGRLNRASGSLDHRPCSTSRGRLRRVDAAEIRKASEVELLTPDERQQLLNDRVVTDLGAVPPEFLARVRAKGKALVESRCPDLKHGD